MSTAYAAIIEAFGDVGAVSAITGAAPKAVRAWKRDGVPARLWPLLVKAARDRGANGVTFEALGAVMEEGEGASPRPRAKRAEAGDAARAA